MPKLPCPCGKFVHDLSPIPDNGWITVRDKDYERLLDAEYKRTQLKDVSQEGEHIRIVMEVQRLLYECPVCGRIMWQKENSKDYSVYVPDDSL
jgi:hypothetical protein